MAQELEWKDTIYKNTLGARDCIKSDDGHETIKLVLCKHGYDEYELGEDEHFLDDLEDELLDWGYRIDDTESEEDESDEGDDMDSG